MKAKVLTVSDGVVHGTREDRSGAALVEQLAGAGYEVVDHVVTADGTTNVAGTLVAMAHDFAGLIVTTGGTGFAPRDQTPEGTRAAIERRRPAWPRRCASSARWDGCQRDRRRARAGADLQHARLADGLRRATRRDPRRAPPRPTAAARRAGRPLIAPSPMSWSRRGNHRRCHRASRPHHGVVRIRAGVGLAIVPIRRRSPAGSGRASRRRPGRRRRRCSGPR